MAAAGSGRRSASPLPGPSRAIELGRAPVECSGAVLSSAMSVLTVRRTCDPARSHRRQQRGTMERLWTPWRMGYVGGPKAAGCIFCEKLAAGDDRANLILHRGAHAFVIMNLFPY